MVTIVKTTDLYSTWNVLTGQISSTLSIKQKKGTMWGNRYVALIVESFHKIYAYQINTLCTLNALFYLSKLPQ